MSVAMADGPGGLEFTHQFAPGDGGTAVLMNKLMTTDLSTILLPRVKFDRMPGFRSLPEADDNREQRTARIGSTVLPSLVRDKTFTVDGKLQAANMTDLRGLERQMLAAFGERNVEGTWSAIPLAAWDPVNGATDYWQASMRVMAYEPQTDFPAGLNALPSAYQLPFVLTMRMSDPRWFWTDAATATHASSATATNLGSAPADPTITVAGASGTVTITNTTVDNRQLVFLGLPSGSLVIDFDARTALIGASDALPYLDTYESDWWDIGIPGLRSGANTITQSGGTSVTVDWQHAAW